MREIMLDAAMRLMQDGLIPSVGDVAEAAQVSRASAYRYFATQASLIQAALAGESTEKARAGTARRNGARGGSALLKKGSRVKIK
jgi:AcrR family transcriptional regulator